MKKCSSCLVEKSVCAFKKRKDSKDGFRGQCTICFSEKEKARRVFNRDKKKEYDLVYRSDNSIKLKRQQKIYYAEHVDEIKIQKKEYRKRNKARKSKIDMLYRSLNRESIAESKRVYANKNKHIINSISARRRARKNNATPVWSEVHMINEVYKKAQELSILLDVKMVVDHVIPLHNKNVCGLHVWANLQILESTINLKKSNIFNGGR